MKNIEEILNNCSTKGRIILIPNKIDENLFLRLKSIMYENGGEYYPSVKYKGFVFREFDASTDETENLLKKLKTIKYGKNRK